MEYIGEHLLPGKIGHFFLLLSFVASLLAMIAYFLPLSAGKALKPEPGKILEESPSAFMELAFF